MTRLFLFSLKGFAYKRMRTALSVVGIAVSAACVMLITTLGTVGANALNRELDSMGLNGISVNCSEPLDGDDVDMITKIDGVQTVAPVTGMYSNVTAESNTAQSYLWGIDGKSDFIISAKPVYGRGITPDDVTECRDVCMIDRALAAELFGDEHAVGKTVSLALEYGQLDCTVIGVCEADSGILKSVSGSFAPYFVYAPYTCLQVAQSTSGFSWIAVKSKNSDTATLCDRITHEFESVNMTVEVDDISAQRASLDKMLTAVTFVLTAIAAVSLIVSGISIMTSMLSSVNERTGEIGIKKALGAGRGVILLEFMLEALTICLSGGIIGSVLGAALGGIGSYVVLGSFGINPSAVLLCALGCAVAGTLFGCYPAYKAASFKPVDALAEQ